MNPGEPMGEYERTLHLRIDSLRAALKEQAIEAANLTRELGRARTDMESVKALLNVEIASLRAQLRNELNINVMLRRERDQLRQTVGRDA